LVIVVNKQLFQSVNLDWGYDFEEMRVRVNGINGCSILKLVRWDRQNRISSQ
jgi:hypothetical protein